VELWLFIAAGYKLDVQTKVSYCTIQLLTSGKSVGASL